MALWLRNLLIERSAELIRCNAPIEIISLKLKSPPNFVWRAAFGIRVYYYVKVHSGLLGFMTWMCINLPSESENMLIFLFINDVF